jgi:hypothetical protein
MDIREIYRNWTNAIAGLRGKNLVTGGIGNDSLTLPASRRQTAPASGSANNVDPIMLMDAHRDADLRLQRKFEEIKREEVNILDKLIPMD